MINKKDLIASVAIVAAIGLGWQMFNRDEEVKPGALFLPNNAKVVAAGKKLYSDNCASCHGDDLAGEPNWQTPGADGKRPAPPHNKDGHTWLHQDQLLFDQTKYGAKKLMKLPDYKTNMPVFEGVLSDEEIIAVFSYIKSTWPRAIQKRHDGVNATNCGSQ